MSAPTAESVRDRHRERCCRSRPPPGGLRSLERSHHGHQERGTARRGRAIEANTESILGQRLRRGTRRGRRYRGQSHRSTAADRRPGEGHRRWSAPKWPRSPTLLGGRLRKTLPNGLELQQLRVPLGVVGIVYEARPNVTVDASVSPSSPAMQVLLRGSSSAASSNAELVRILREVLADRASTPTPWPLLPSEDRASVTALIRAALVDVVIPRGGAGLINAVVSNATVPTIETGTGNCPRTCMPSPTSMSPPAVLNAKTRRPSVCNTAETGAH